MVEAAAVVGNCRDHAAAQARKRHPDSALRGFACRNALRRCLNAVINAVAQQMQQGFRQRPQYRSIHAKVVAGDLQQCVAPYGCAGLAHRSAQAGVQARQRAQPRLCNLKAGFPCDVELSLGQHGHFAQRR